LVPDLKTAESWPPPECPNSAGTPVVKSFTSVIASGGGGDHLIRSANGAAHRFLGAQPVQHVSHGALALSHGVDAVDDLCSGRYSVSGTPASEEQDLDESIDSQHSTGCRGLGFE
jgi:hypothetical protein